MVEEVAAARVEGATLTTRSAVRLCPFCGSTYDCHDAWTCFASRPDYRPIDWLYLSSPIATIVELDRWQRGVWDWQ